MPPTTFLHLDGSSLQFFSHLDVQIWKWADDRYSYLPATTFSHLDSSSLNCFNIWMSKSKNGQMQLLTRNYTFKFGCPNPKMARCTNLPATMFIFEHQIQKWRTNVTHRTTGKHLWIWKRKSHSDPKMTMIMKTNLDMISPPSKYWKKSIFSPFEFGWLTDLDVTRTV